MRFDIGLLNEATLRRDGSLDAWTTTVADLMQPFMAADRGVVAVVYDASQPKLVRCESFAATRDARPLLSALSTALTQSEAGLVATDSPRVGLYRLRSAAAALGMRSD